MSTKNKVLVAGASGLIGVAAIESFLAAGWDVVGISRRKPELPSGRDFRFISADLRDDKAARQALSPLADVTHVAYAAIYENAHDLVGGWSEVGMDCTVWSPRNVKGRWVETISGDPRLWSGPHRSVFVASCTNTSKASSSEGIRTGLPT